MTIKSPELERTTHCERQYSEGSIARTESKTGAADQSGLHTFDTLVARYHPTIYTFACQLTNNPREAVVLTREAIDKLRKQLRTSRDEDVLASIPNVHPDPGGSWRSLSRTDRHKCQ